MRFATPPLKRMTLSRCLAAGGLALRWALLLFLVFDQMATPFQGYRHDVQTGGSAFVQIHASDTHVALQASCLSGFSSAAVQPAAPAQAHMTLFVATASDEEDRAPWLDVRLVLISLWSDWSAWPDATASVDRILSVDPPSPRMIAVSERPHTRAPPLHA